MTGTNEQRSRELPERTPDDYAIEHAGYLANAAKRLLEVRDAHDALLIRRDEGDEVTDDEVQEAEESVGDANDAMRYAIYEFEKRRDRALAEPKAGAVPDAVTLLRNFQSQLGPRRPRDPDDAYTWDHIERTIHMLAAPQAKPVIDPSWSLHDRVEFALRDAGFDLDEAAFVAEAAGKADAAEQHGRSLDDLVAEWERDPQMRAALERARSRRARKWE